MKSVRLGYLRHVSSIWREHSRASVTYLSEENGELQLDGICLVAGLGNTENREGTLNTMRGLL